MIPKNFKRFNITHYQLEEFINYTIQKDPNAKYMIFKNINNDKALLRENDAKNFNDLFHKLINFCAHTIDDDIWKTIMTKKTMKDLENDFPYLKFVFENIDKIVTRFKVDIHDVLLSSYNSISFENAKNIRSFNYPNTTNKIHEVLYNFFTIIYSIDQIISKKISNKNFIFLKYDDIDKFLKINRTKLQKDLNFVYKLTVYLKLRTFDYSRIYNNLQINSFFTDKKKKKNKIYYNLYYVIKLKFELKLFNKILKGQNQHTKYKNQIDKKIRTIINQLKNEMNEIDENLNTTSQKLIQLINIKKKLKIQDIIEVKNKDALKINKPFLSSVVLSDSRQKISYNIISDDYNTKKNPDDVIKDQITKKAKIKQVSSKILNDIIYKNYIYIDDIKQENIITMFTAYTEIENHIKN